MNSSSSKTNTLKKQDSIQKEVEMYTLSKTNLTKLNFSTKTTNLDTLAKKEISTELDSCKLIDVAGSADGKYIILIYDNLLQIKSNIADGSYVNIDLKNIQACNFVSENIFVAFKPYNSSYSDGDTKEKENLFIIEIEIKEKEIKYKTIRKIEHSTNNLSTNDVIHVKTNNTILRKTRNNTIEISELYKNEIKKTVKIQDVNKMSLSKNEQNILCFIKSGDKSMPSVLKIFDLNFNVVKSQKSFFNLDDLTFNWSNTGDKVLCIGQSDFDTSGKSYYGESKLFYLTEDGKYDCKIPLNGPVYAVEWSPKSNEFIVLYGYMPSNMVLYNTKVETIKTMNKVSKNHARYSIDGKYFSLSGFGALNGNIDVYKRSTYKKICSIATRATSVMEFIGNDIIVTATLHKNLKVDNCLNLYSIYGHHLHKIDYVHLSQIFFKQINASFIDRDSVPSSNTPQTQNQNESQQQTKYTPPHARNNTSTNKKTAAATINNNINENEETKKEIEKLEKRLAKATRLRSRLINSGIQLSESEKKLVNSSSDIAFKIDVLNRKL